MPEDGLASFHALLHEYWPAMTDSPKSLEPSYRAWGSQPSHMALTSAIELEKVEEPNSKTPNLKRLRLRLEIKPHQSGTTEFQRLLRNMRDADPGVTKNMSDETMWRCSVEARKPENWDHYLREYDATGQQAPIWLQAVPGKVLEAKA